MIPRHTPCVGRAARVDRRRLARCRLAADRPPAASVDVPGSRNASSWNIGDRSADEKNQHGGHGDQSEQPARGCDLDPDDQGQGQRRLDQDRGQRPPHSGHSARRAPPAAEVGGDERGGHDRREDHRLPDDHLHQVQHRRGAISPPGHTAAAGRDRRPPVEQLIELAGRPRSRPAENDVGELVDRCHDSDNRTSRNRRATHDRAQSEQTHPRWPSGASPLARLTEQPVAQHADRHDQRQPRPHHHDAHEPRQVEGVGDVSAVSCVGQSEPVGLPHDQRRMHQPRQPRPHRPRRLLPRLRQARRDSRRSHHYRVADVLDVDEAARDGHAPRDGHVCCLPPKLRTRINAGRSPWPKTRIPPRPYAIGRLPRPPGQQVPPTRHRARIRPVRLGQAIPLYTVARRRRFNSVPDQ